MYGVDIKKRKTSSKLEEKNLEEHIRTKNNTEILQALKEEASFDEEDLKKTGQLKGRHLINAFKTYKVNIESNKTPETAIEALITSLMEENITDKSIAKSIAFWLIAKFTAPKPKKQLEPSNYIYEESDEIDRKYLKVIGLGREELLFLRYLNKCNLKDLTAPSSMAMDRLSFKLKHRENTTKQIIEVAETHYKNFYVENQNKQHINFFIASGGSGCGKTRILAEIPNVLRTIKLDNIFAKTNIIYFNFANGLSLADTDRDHKPISMILSRIIFAAFEHPELFINTPASDNNLFLYEVMRIISEKLHEKYGDAIIPLVLAFDEYQLATRANPNLNNSIQHILGWYMRNIQSKHGIILFPAFAGTLSESDVKMEPTQYTPVHLALPSLRPIDITEIMADMGLSTLYEGEYKDFWNMIGIVPRHLEWALGNDTEKLKTLVLNDEVVKSTIYINIVNTVMKQYHHNLYDDYYGKLALDTLSGLKQKLNEDEKLTKYIKEGRVYLDDNGLIGIPLVVIDVLSTKMNYIPKGVVSDFITVSNKPLRERFEELFLKTMTARFNVLYTTRCVDKVLFSELFKGAHYKSGLGCISLLTANSSWFEYDILDAKISKNKDENNDLIDHVTIKKAKKNQNDIDGVLCPLTNAKTNKRMVFVTLNKFQYEDSHKGMIEPTDLVSYYEKAIRTSFKDSDTFVIIFTNKTVPKNTKEMIINGQITKSKKGQSKITVDTSNLILVSGDCFPNFFHPFISNNLQ